jgi:hypothetical protein
MLVQEAKVLQVPIAVAHHDAEGHVFEQLAETCERIATGAVQLYG